MSEAIITRRTVIGGVITAGAVLAGGEVARHYGEQFGRGARSELEQTDLQAQYDQFVGLIRGTDLQGLIVEKIHSGELNIDWLIQEAIAYSQEQALDE